MSSDGIAAQLTSINAPLDLRLLSCSDLATNSFPVPFSPKINTRASVGAILLIVSCNSVIEAESPTILLCLCTFFLRTLVCCFKLPCSIAFLTAINKRFRSGGFCIKSKAPNLVASTAVSIFP